MKKRQIKKQNKQLTAERKTQEIKLMLKKLELYKEHLTIHLIEADRIAPPPNEESDPMKDLGRLCESIRRCGLIEPLTVRRVCGEETSFGGVYTLISGKRRFAALKQLGLTKVPCKIIETPASKAKETRLNVRMNEGKNDVFSLAEAANEFKKETNMDISALCASLSCGRERMERLLALSDFSLPEREVCRTLQFPEKLVFLLGQIENRRDRARAIAECGSCLKHLYRTYETCGDARKEGILTSLLPFFNAADRLTAQLRSAGIAARCKRTEREDSFTVTIEIPKRSARTVVVSPESTNVS